jgi:hypothetical protein
MLLDEGDEIVVILRKVKAQRQHDRYQDEYERCPRARKHALLEIEIEIVEDDLSRLVAQKEHYQKNDELNDDIEH